MLVKVNFMLSISVLLLIVLNYFTNTVNTSPLIITSLIGLLVLLIGVENFKSGSKFNGVSFMVASALLFLVVVLIALGIV
ncbi:hypothetical protein [Alkalibacillus haloalkaliphilus]|uniref:hypothetical protein n=1 Tax=Alkalibacillus haloalkaliphilus TaxID=94136 RepID=UPI0002FEC099|nr:hypothetical protein [Alkalibacillus haloalkaliphilus]